MVKLPCATCAGKDETIACLRDEKEKLASIGAAGVIKRGELKAVNDDLLAALESLMPMAKMGSIAMLNESHPEERAGHADGIETMFDDAWAAINKAKGAS